MARHRAGKDLIDVEVRAVAFDGANFEHAYRAHGPLLRATAYRVLHDREAAQDAVQSALMRVWSSGAYRSERGPLLPFLIACVRREALDAVRAAQRRTTRERRAAADAVLPDPTAALDPLEARRVAAALARLSIEQRDVIVRVYYGGRTLADVASACDVPLGTIKSRLSQALRRLGRELSGGTS